MDYQHKKRIIQELFRENLRLYPESYPADLQESLIHCANVALGYWDNRNDLEIEEEQGTDISKIDYVLFCIEEYGNYISEGTYTFKQDNSDKEY